MKDVKKKKGIHFREAVILWVFNPVLYGLVYQLILHGGGKNAPNLTSKLEVMITLNLASGLLLIKIFPKNCFKLMTSLQYVTTNFGKSKK